MNFIIFKLAIYFSVRIAVFDIKGLLESKVRLGGPKTSIVTQTENWWRIDFLENINILCIFGWCGVGNDECCEYCELSHFGSVSNSNGASHKHILIDSESIRTHSIYIQQPCHWNWALVHLSDSAIFALCQNFQISWKNVTFRGLTILCFKMFNTVNFQESLRIETYLSYVMAQFFPFLNFEKFAIIAWTKDWTFRNFYIFTFNIGEFELSPDL